MRNFDEYFTYVMKNQYVIILVIFLFFTCFLSSCKEPDPTVAKVFVRNSFKELLVGVEVLIVANADSFPPLDVVALTNSSGYASFNLEEYFSQFSADAPKIADFKIYINKTGVYSFVGNLRSRANITAVETVFFDLE